MNAALEAARNALAHPEIAFPLLTAGLLLISIEMVKPGKVWPLSAGLVLAGAGISGLVKVPIHTAPAFLFGVALAAIFLPKLPLAVVTSLFFASAGLKLWLPESRFAGVYFVCAAGVCTRYAWLAHHGLRARRLKRNAGDAQVKS